MTQPGVPVLATRRTGRDNGEVAHIIPEDPRSTDIWIVLIEDRHADVEVRPFSSEERAAGYAMSQVADTPADLNDAMRKDGWVLYVPYGTERRLRARGQAHHGRVPVIPSLKRSP